MARKGLEISFDSKQIISRLQGFSNALQEKAMRPATFTVCTVLYNEIVLTTPEDKGTLKAAPYRWRDASSSGDSLEVWKVGINHKKAPHFHLVENGYWQKYKVVKLPDGSFFTTDQLLPSPKWIPPNAYFRAAYDSKINVALQAGLKDLSLRLEKLV